MHERAKLSEAKYFFSRMAATYNLRPEFNFNLSAFLAATRSVLQYAHKETKNKPGGQEWYETKTRQSPVLQFFKNKRDINIHTQPVAPAMNVAIKIRGQIVLSDSVSIVVRDSKGNIKSRWSSEPPQPRPAKPASQGQPVAETISYRFSDWKGTEDVAALSQKYLDELQELVDEGERRGFVTPKQTG